MLDSKNIMEYRFSIIKREFENDALTAFIDLLGTRKLYESTSTEEQANKALNDLLGEFDIKFSEHFPTREIKQNFDVSIFADSIVISERKRTPKIVERLVDFLLDYQEYLLLNFDSPSRAILAKDSFFSFKITGASTKSILGSQYTNISLCGGRGIKFAHDCLEGLPIGVYVTARIEEDLNAEQRARVIPVKDEKLSFIKKKTSMPFLPSETLDLLLKKPNIGRKAIMNSLKASFPDKDAFEKMAPWILVHLGKENEIIRSNKPRKSDAAKNLCVP